jgi:hypothetical protein
VKLAIELLEANGANDSEVSTATDVLLSRGIECFWILADTNVIAAAPTVVHRCRTAGVPVITNFTAIEQLGAASARITLPWACGPASSSLRAPGYAPPTIHSLQHMGTLSRPFARADMSISASRLRKLANCSALKFQIVHLPVIALVAIKKGGKADLIWHSFGLIH